MVDQELLAQIRQTGIRFVDSARNMAVSMEALVQALERYDQEMALKTVQPDPDSPKGAQVEIDRSDNPTTPTDTLRPEHITGKSD